MNTGDLDALLWLRSSSAYGIAQLFNTVVARHILALPTTGKQGIEENDRPQTMTHQVQPTSFLLLLLPLLEFQNSLMQSIDNPGCHVGVHLERNISNNLK